MRQQPAGKLPVAAYPAVSAARFDGVAGRMLFNEINIGYQGGSCITAFQQVMT